jgi:hypothetical protein
LVLPVVFDGETLGQWSAVSVRTAVSVEPVLAGLALAVLVDDDTAGVATVAVVVVLAALAPTLEVLVGTA